MDALEMKNSGLSISRSSSSMIKLRNTLSLYKFGRNSAVSSNFDSKRKERGREKRKKKGGRLKRCA